MWEKEDPVHPLYNGYKKIIDTIMKESENLRSWGERPWRRHLTSLD
jgi:hypothetical protein